jgi:hypothetical protein
MRVTSSLLPLFMIAGSRIAPAVINSIRRFSTSFAIAIRPWSARELFIMWDRLLASTRSGIALPHALRR